LGLQGQELSPCRPGPLGSRIESGTFQDCPDGRGGHRLARPTHPESCCSPSGEVAWAIRDTRAWIGGEVGGRPARRPRVGPASGNELGVPAQHARTRPGETSRSWRSGMGSSLPSALSTARSRLVSGGWPGVGAAQHGDLVAQRADFDGSSRPHKTAGAAHPALRIGYLPPGGAGSSGSRRAKGFASPVSADGLVLEVDALGFRQREDDQGGDHAERDAVPDERTCHVAIGEERL
jgi:hypothetical protein